MIAWFVCEFRIEPDPLWKANRVCLIFDFHDDIMKMRGGKYAFIETRDGRALVKVNALRETIERIEAAEGFTRLKIGVNALREFVKDDPRRPEGLGDDGQMAYGEQRPRTRTQTFEWLNGQVR